ncbi:MAG: hypothetical protein HON46_02215, partial [Gammaproteobacteria bacterium]|nr:hypothetical protein [Gammaproteobacteria bacterium]
SSEAATNLPFPYVNLLSQERRESTRCCRSLQTVGIGSSVAKPVVQVISTKRSAFCLTAVIPDVL